MLLVLLVLGSYFFSSILSTVITVADLSELAEAHRIASYVAGTVAGTINWLPDWQATANQIPLPKKIGDDEYYLKLRVREVASLGGMTIGRIEVILQLGGRWHRRVSVVVSVPVVVGRYQPGYLRPGVVMIDPEAYLRGVIRPVNEWPEREWWCSTSSRPFTFAFYVIPPPEPQPSPPWSGPPGSPGGGGGIPGPPPGGW